MAGPGWIEKWVPRLMVLVLGVAIGVWVVSATVGTGVGPIDSYVNSSTDSVNTDKLNTTKIERVIHQEVNDRRQNNGLSPLDYNSQLARIAEAHSSHMAQVGYFSHEAPNGSNFADRYARYGFSCSVSVNSSTNLKGGENIAYTWSDQLIERKNGEQVDHNNNETKIGEAIVWSWMHSEEGHREQILQPAWNQEGVGVAVDYDDPEGVQVIATQNFC